MEEERRNAVLLALERFRAVLEGDGTILIQAGVDESLASRRREDMIGRTVDQTGMNRLHAELIFDIAVDEGLDPAFAFELVRSGVAVCDAPRDAPVPVDDTLLEGAPEWIAPEAVSEPLPTEDLVRERRMRTSFRRLHGHLERCATPEEAIEAFCAEPDVGVCGYLL